MPKKIYTYLTVNDEKSTLIRTSKDYAEADLTNRTRQTFGLGSVGSDHNVSIKFVTGRFNVQTRLDRYPIKRPDHSVHAIQCSPSNRISR